MKSYTIKIQDRGIMMSEYFSGTPGIMLPIYIDSQTTKSESLEMLED